MIDKTKYNEYLNDKELMRANISEILKHKNDYYSFANAEFAKATYDYLLPRYPEALFFVYDDAQYICATKKAVAKLHHKFSKRRNILIAELLDINNMINNIEKIIK